ncbi:RNA polymerase sigma factor [Tautonia plasticadhaerens]|uniref:ECF RNA polymerase sigma factor SigE n=1 Tax=Tautonia plasticadhaerens TaxID=2527974 RepID=A0A518HD58_9BACT|nr:RNA polymerase sigma factor [Tautonia plasticadhaerens]QDV38606.1 ECF RNA polymerase sigma factor SigE [Tautonia plasticadhaerens]
MPRTINGEAHRHLRTLFGGGAAGGLSDGQLLERFNARDGPGAERAFAELVGRHGPMVLRLARSILRDRDAAEDAFQAAFLALARRAGSLWVRDSIGPWLNAVTVRLSTRMRSDRARRRLLDERAASRSSTSNEPGEADDLGAALHEEIARLPDRHRLPIVLCLVEGLTHDEAARRLDWPVGTVRSRLARGRDRLRDRLARRGISPSAIPIGLGIRRSAPEVVHASLRAATVRAAVSATHGGLIAAAGAVPAGTIAAVIAVLREMTMIQRTLLVVGLVASGVLAAEASRSAQSRSELPPTTNPPPESSTPSLESESESITRVYSVGDLIFIPHAERILSLKEDGTSVATVSPGLASFGPLIDLLTSTVAPGTWTVGEPRSGDGSTVTDRSITPFHLNLSLIVRHSPEVHEQVVERLRQLRRIVGPLAGVGEEVEEHRPVPVPGGLGQTRGPSNPDQSPLARPNRPEGGLAPSESSETTESPRARLSTDGTLLESPFGLVPSARSSGRTTTDQADRIEALEQKLDAILEELRSIRAEGDRLDLEPLDGPGS